uniref:Tropomyosin n=1 Tax=Macrostomum lignano TaxID=282301 RepID=A0A1I8FNX7_9PLAT
MRPSFDRVKKQLEQLQCETDQVEQQATKVEAENNALRPELDSLKEAHDANFVRLNELLAEKAARQIEASSRIVDLEEDTVLLAEQMVEERQQYADTMRSIREQTYEVEHQLKDCTDKEDKKSREFLAVHGHPRRVEIRTGEALSTQSRVLEAEHQTQVAEMQKDSRRSGGQKAQQQTVKKEKVVAQKTEVTARTVAVATKVKEETSKDSEEKKQMPKKAVAAKESDLVKMRQEILDMEGRHAELAGDAERQ